MTLTRREPARAREQVAFRDVPLVALLPLWLVGAFVVGYVVVTFPAHHWLGVDAHAYWLTARHARLYDVAPGTVDAYNYSPAFAQLIWPLAALPWPVFLTLWFAAQAAVFAWLLAPLGWRWAVPFWMSCSLAIAFGNIWPFLAAVFVIGRIRPAAWSFAVLTKVTPGIGMLWHAARGEWRRLGMAALTVAGISLVSAALDPSAWREWFEFLAHSSGDGSGLVVRLPVAGALVVAAARRPRLNWLLPLALILSVPILAGWQWITVLAAIPRLVLGRSVAPQENFRGSSQPSTEERPKGRQCDAARRRSLRLGGNARVH